ncbi:hypothetical protein E0L36_23525 [Streptomyces sp. AJS327]|uniref:hypothetical protein n=1 Tax=Streptomyces sp. AJS327 TaxID=2545265 RepID=UPI0015DEFFE3|nr:hypothetical protein [Streptomyces sp. AJS327]MBA0053724.1 hypothetical protein [Streptomyces sp. AJS327]
MSNADTTPSSPAAGSHAAHGAHEHGAHAAQGHGAHEHGSAAPGGLHASLDGYTLELSTPEVAAGTTEIRFAIVEDVGADAGASAEQGADAGRGADAGARRVTAYRQLHGKELHLIIAARDLTVYRHLHPTRAADGGWSAPVELPRAGAYRLFADFAPEGREEGLTLGADLTVTGEEQQVETPEESDLARVDGYEVRLAGRPSGGAPSPLTLRVARDGRPVTDLEPYLGAYGHLVALRSGDLAYLHVHPHGEPGDGRTRPGPDVTFTAVAPSAGVYRLFFDFQHEGTVRTAAFTVRADEGERAPDGGSKHREEHTHHAHHAADGQHTHHPQHGHHA